MADQVDQDQCNGDAVDVGYFGLRIASIFIILVASGVGAFAPVILARQSKIPVPKFAFFVCKYIGTGVIIATAWLHLLDPAVGNLSDACLEPMLGDYPWPEAIGLWTVLLMFFFEMLASRSLDSHGSPSTAQKEFELDPAMDVVAKSSAKDSSSAAERGEHDGPLNEPHDHLAHRHSHEEGDSHPNVGGQLLDIFILEFGVLFHSVFIGLTLGTTDNVIVLLVVLVFHQMFEGLGLGSRLAVAPWPKDKQWLPYLLAFCFCLSTPIGIAAGVGAKPNNANTQKLVNGIFDSISAGILMYTGLVELLAHEFMFNPTMRKASLKVLLFAFACIAFGMAIMAVLAKWA
ncbi:hypothetical protein V2G26_020546 [Clonostachys chloroleuca]|uniref:Membrane zinc transporter n=1 Tax=Clonostachys chloroleuca TaxID=1926264 RepID=A0AA35LPM5_9HYPO|nr:unnamed protein product [Clonostachys chloroleuca]